MVVGWEVERKGRAILIDGWMDALLCSALLCLCDRHDGGREGGREGGVEVEVGGVCEQESGCLLH